MAEIGKRYNVYYNEKIIIENEIMTAIPYYIVKDYKEKNEKILSFEQFKQKFKIIDDILPNSLKLILEEYEISNDSTTSTRRTNYIRNGRELIEYNNSGKINKFGVLTQWSNNNSNANFNKFMNEIKKLGYYIKQINNDYDSKNTIQKSEYISNNVSKEDEYSINNKLVKRLTGGLNILLYGVPGVGKSYYIKTNYCSDENFIERVVFHPDYNYSDFVGQILPRVDENNKLKYIFTPGPFTKILKRAYEDPEHEYYLIIEELNRGNAPAIFGEIFQLLDRVDEANDEYDASIIGESEYGISNYDVAKEVYGNAEHQVKIPSNMYILATMNTADQNVFTLDTAFQRRWNMKQIRNVMSEEQGKIKIEGTNITWEVFSEVINRLIVDINSEMSSSEDKRLGAYFVKKNQFTIEKFSEKVLKYLWDDAFKFNRESIFKDNYRSLEEIIMDYESETNEDRLKVVLRQEVYEQMASFMKKRDNI